MGVYFADTGSTLDSKFNTAAAGPESLKIIFGTVGIGPRSSVKALIPGTANKNKIFKLRIILCPEGVRGPRSRNNRPHRRPHTYFSFLAIIILLFVPFFPCLPGGADHPKPCDMAPCRLLGALLTGSCQAMNMYRVLRG